MQRLWEGKYDDDEIPALLGVVEERVEWQLPSPTS